MRVVLIFNPRSGRGKPKDELLPRVLDRLGEAGMEVWARPTEKRGHASKIASQAAAAGYDRVIAWGGDGTLNEVAEGLLETQTAMGVLPGGTVNVFARELGIPLKLDGALDVLVEGRVVRIPVGLADDRPFLLMAGVGLFEDEHPAHLLMLHDLRLSVWDRAHERTSEFYICLEDGELDDLHAAVAHAMKKRDAIRNAIASSTHLPLLSDIDGES